MGMLRMRDEWFFNVEIAAVYSGWMQANAGTLNWDDDHNTYTYQTTLTPIPRVGDQEARGRTYQYRSPVMVMQVNKTNIPVALHGLGIPIKLDKMLTQLLIDPQAKVPRSIVESILRRGYNHVPGDAMMQFDNTIPGEPMSL